MMLEIMLKIIMVCFPFSTESAVLLETEFFWTPCYSGGHGVTGAMPEIEFEVSLAVKSQLSLCLR